VEKRRKKGENTEKARSDSKAESSVL